MVVICNFLFFFLVVLQSQYLFKPPPESVPHNFSSGWFNDHGQFGQPLSLDREIFKKRIKNGFFVEAGAADGEDISNSLYYELRHNWTGILIEGDPQGFSKMKTKVNCLLRYRSVQDKINDLYFNYLFLFQSF